MSNIHENKLLKLTVSNDQLTKLHDSNILQDNTNIIKKVTSLNANRIETKHKNSTSEKSYKVKLTNYKKKQTAFNKAFNELIISYKLIKNFNKNVLSDKNNLEFEELDNIVQKTLQDKCGIACPKSEASFKKDHGVFVFNHNLPLAEDINSTTGYQKLDLSIKETYEYVWKNYLEVSKMNMKYNFWLKNIIKPNEFYDLHAVREYLIENMFDKEQTAEKIEPKLNDFYNNFQLKFINIINEADNILNSENKVVKKDENEELEMNAEIKLQMAIEEHKQKMDVKIKMLEMENEKLKKYETQCSTKIKTLLGELAFRNNKLNNAKDHILLLTKERNDLISTIQKIEVKDESYQTLKNKILEEQKKNRNLSNMLSEEYDQKYNNF